MFMSWNQHLINYLSIFSIRERAIFCEISKIVHLLNQLQNLLTQMGQMRSPALILNREGVGDTTKSLN